jgi:hypothetical protein
LRAAVSVAFDIPYARTPAVKASDPEFWATWTFWGQDRGLALWQSREIAPIHRPRWVALVDAPAGPDGALHAIAMQYDQILYDPNEGTPYERHVVHAADVRTALFFAPPGRYRAGACWLITNPAPLVTQQEVA